MAVVIAHQTRVGDQQSDTIGDEAVTALVLVSLAPV